MVSCMVQTIAVMLGCTATILTCAICGMPHWRVAVLAETNSYGKRLDGHWIGRWDGLWMTCVRQSNHPMSCQLYSQTLSMTPDLKVSRILMSFAVMTAFAGCVCSFIGMLYEKCRITNKSNRRCFLLLAGMSFIMAGILVLAPVTLIAINIMKEVCFSSCKNIQQQEIGEAIMLAWPTVMIFFIAGAIFCWYHPCVCSHKRCMLPSEDPQPEEHQAGQELHVFLPTRRQNQDIVI